MIRLRTYKYLIAAATAFAVLLQAVLLAACPHAGPHSGAGTKVTSHFDAVLGWLTICNNSGQTTDGTSPSNHQRTGHDCCTAVCASATTAVFAFIAVLLAVLIPERQGRSGLRFTRAQLFRHVLHYGGRGSRAPPAFA